MNCNIKNGLQLIDWKKKNKFKTRIFVFFSNLGVIHNNLFYYRNYQFSKLINCTYLLKLALFTYIFIENDFSIMFLNNWIASLNPQKGIRSNL